MEVPKEKVDLLILVFYNFYEIKEIGRSTNFSFYYFHETNEIVEALGGPSSIVMPRIREKCAKIGALISN